MKLYHSIKKLVLKCYHKQLPLKKMNRQMETRVVNIYKEKYDVYIGRAGRGENGYFGNPYQLGVNELKVLQQKTIKDNFIIDYLQMKNLKQRLKN